LEERVTIKKWVTIEEIGQRRKIGHTRKKGHTRKNPLNLEQRVTLVNVVPLGKMGHTFKNG